MAHVFTWNTAFEDTPANGDDAKEGAARIRDLKDAIRERMTLDHSWDPASPSATNDGRHKMVTLLQQSSDLAAVTDAFRLYSKDATGNQLFGRDEAGNVIQFTRAGKISLLNQTNNWEKGQRTAITTLTDAATVTPDCNDTNVFRWTMGGNRTLANPSNAVDGFVMTIIIRQDATGGRTITYGSKWLFPDGPLKQPASGANDFSVISAVYSSGFDKWFASMARDYV